MLRTPNGTRLRSINRTRENIRAAAAAPIDAEASEATLGLVEHGTRGLQRAHEAVVLRRDGHSAAPQRVLEELRAKGYVGGYSSVSERLRSMRPAPVRISLPTPSYEPAI